MKGKLIALLSLIFLIASAVTPASAQTPKATVIGIVENACYDFSTQSFQIPQGEKIEFRITVKVDADSPVPLNGFWIYLELKKPSGAKVTKWFDFTREYIGIGQFKSYSLKTGVTADELGFWSYEIKLYTSTKSFIYGTVGSFEVVKPLARVTVDQIIGYTTVAGLILAGLYLIRTRW